jgi:hypothetical protein
VTIFDVTTDVPQLVFSEVRTGVCILVLLKLLTLKIPSNPLKEMATLWCLLKILRLIYPHRVFCLNTVPQVKYRLIHVLKNCRITTGDLLSI